LKTLFGKRVFKLSQKLSGQGQSSRRALLRPNVLTTAHIKFYLLKAKELKFFAKLFAKSLPPEARVLPDKSQFVDK